MGKLNSKQREKLYDRCRGEAEFPTCNLCELPVRIGDDWDESHLPVPKALGGTETGIAHSLCNRLHGALVVTPMVAKVKRGRRKHIGAHRSRCPMRGGHRSKERKTLHHGVQPRITLAQWMQQMREAGLIVTPQRGEVAP